jgi:hypothetical protein
MNKSIYDSNPNPEEGLVHLTINTGHSVTHNLSRLRSSTYESLKPLLRHRVGLIPGLPQFTVAWKTRQDNHAIVMSKCGTPVILCGLATGTCGATELWDGLLNFNFPLSTNSTGNPTQPAATPWLAAGLLPTVALLNPIEAQLLGSFEAFLALAIMRYNAELN